VIVTGKIIENDIGATTNHRVGGKAANPTYNNIF